MKQLVFCCLGSVVLLHAGAASAGLSRDNPAATLCKTDGASVEIETAPNGSQHSVCVFPSGERINAWAYFRNKHRTKN